MNPKKRRSSSEKRGDCQKNTRKRRSFCETPKNREELLKKLVKHQKSEKNHQLSQKNRKRTNVLDYIGVNTMPIMLLLFWGFKGLTVGYLFLKKKPMVLLASFPALVGMLGFMRILYTLAEVCIPLVTNAVYLEVKTYIWKSLKI